MGSYIGNPSLDTLGNPVDKDSPDNVGGRDVFGIANIPGVIQLPNANSSMLNDVNNKWGSFQNATSTGNLVTNVYGAITEGFWLVVAFIGLLFSVVTFMPDMLVLFGVPQPIVDLIGFGMIIITIVAIVQVVSNKWFSIGE